MKKLIAAVVLIMFVLALTSIQTLAKTKVSAENFYKKNQVLFMVNGRPGGGTDIAARLISQYWNEVTGGKIRVVNERGGGGLVALNKLYMAKNDGLTIASGVLGAHVVGFNLFKAPGAQYDPLKFEYIATLAPEIYSLTVGIKSPHNSVKDLQKAKKLLFGSPNPHSTPAQGAALFADIFGLKNARIVSGIKGSKLGVFAMRGEIDGYAIAGHIIKRGVDSKLVKPPLLTIASKPNPYYPSAPVITALTELDSKQKKLLQLFEALTTGKTYITSPKVPKERVEYLRKAFERIMQLSAFQKEAKSLWGIWESGWTGEKTAKEVKKVFAIPRSIVSDLKALTVKYKN